ncbi:MAG: hypothetical protein IPO48_14630 [Saprospiraceae bacterium]|nr:hypothetical protein [Saprospiraceae bacterium]
MIKFQGKKVLKIERDLKALPFDANNIEATVDEPHYARLVDLEDFENGTIEVKMYSQLQDPAPYPGIAGFIGVYFRIAKDDSGFEGIYVRPKVGRVSNQKHRNHAVQYISYPHAKFDMLRKSDPGKYESSAPVALNEWITMRIEVNGETAEMFVNDLKYSSFIVDKMLGKTQEREHWTVCGHRHYWLFQRSKSNKTHLENSKRHWRKGQRYLNNGLANSICKYYACLVNNLDHRSIKTSMPYIKHL